MANPVYVLGVARTDFRRHLSRESLSLRDVVVEAGRGAIADSGISPAEVESGVLGNFAAGQFTGQMHLGSFLCDIDPALRGIPTLHTEAACASGAVAMVTAIQQIAGGLADVALVVGAEQQKTMSPGQGADVLASAGDFVSEKAKYGEYVFPGLFGQIARAYRDHYGLTAGALATVAVKNRLHATLNPQAQMRERAITMEQACKTSDKNPDIASPLRLCDCSQITDGAAAVVLCSEAFLKRASREALKRSAKLLGYGHTTDYLALDRKDVPHFSIARRAVDRAFAMAGLGVSDLQGIEVHDCFSITEILSYELLGLCGPGEGVRLAESGVTAHPAVRDKLGLSPTTARNLPIVNPGGGLIGDGHPVGATGVRQVVEAVTHLRGESGARQVEGARNYLTFNQGGTLTTNVVMIWGGHGR